MNTDPHRTTNAEQLADDLKILLESASEPFEDNCRKIDSLEDSIDGYSDRIKKLPSFVEKVDEEFEKYTSLTKGDMSFLLFAVALQTARQVLVNLYKERISDKQSAKETPWHKEEHTDRTETKYYASIEEIQKNPVPFDAMRKEETVKNGGNPKLNGFNHRFKALGHDPYLGLIFGTANIMTSTITVNEGFCGISSYHVHTGTYLRQGKEVPTDKLYDSADTMVIFEQIYQRLRTEGKEGIKALAVSLFKECIHLRSDIRTAKSLPLPLLSLVSPQLTRVLGYYNIDYLTVKIVEKEYVLSVITDLIIRILYTFCYDEEKDVSKELYRARLLKILMYSNEIATISSSVQTVVRISIGDIKASKYFDFGGSLNTLYRLFTSPQKIAQIKHEYLLSKELEYLKNNK